MVAAACDSHTCIPYFMCSLNLEQIRVDRKYQYINAARCIPVPECAVQTAHSGAGMQCPLQPATATPVYPICMCSLNLEQITVDRKSQYVNAARCIPVPECAVQTEHSCAGMQRPLQQSSATPVYPNFICNLDLERSRVDRKSQYVTAARCIPAAERTVQ